MVTIIEPLCEALKLWGGGGEARTVQSVHMQVLTHLNKCLTRAWCLSHT